MLTVYAINTPLEESIEECREMFQLLLSRIKQLEEENTSVSLLAVIFY